AQGAAPEGLSLAERLDLARAWARSVAAVDRPDLAACEDEAAVALLAPDALPRKVSSAPVTARVDGLLGQHPRVAGGQLELRLDDLLARVSHHRAVHVPRWARWREVRHALLGRERERLRLEELRPRPMTSFVRNRLIQEVYLPLIGANLAKQLGASGDGKRTDQMGLLLLISPPGYGKTTLMEYLAQRLGLVFVKVNGPSLGHGVTSLDPAEAPDATSRQEVEKIGLSLEMASNVMLYLDDIQHTNPELLQKFISLCDGTRRIEGVWRGRTRTYDLRGKRFCIVMAGNPYTESGEQFKIPDMLSNRADTYNLGDILGGAQEAFAESYLENAVTSSPTLAPIATRAPEDLRPFLRLARGEEVEDSAFSHDWSAAERQDVVAVLRHLGRVQRTLLLVNQAYIASAATADAYRLEPPFKLQGSYRNMARLAEKVVPAMTADEVELLVSDHYTGESQTLTTGAEANLLRLAELRGVLSPAQAERWGQIKQDWRRQMLVGGTDDPAAKVSGALLGMAERLEGRLGAIGERLGVSHGVEERLGAIADAVRARPAGDPGLAAGLDAVVKVLAGEVAVPLRNASARVGKLADGLGEEGALARRLATLEGVLAAVFADLGADAPESRGRQAALVNDVAQGGWIDPNERPEAERLAPPVWRSAPVNAGAAAEVADPVLAAAVPVIRDLA
ncbi:MAG TPA: AAA family ATPase, partial [Myxococcota bacterium]|nr:AAA family ATPase [Myxococcota bacterium]